MAENSKFAVGDVVRYCPDATQDPDSANGCYEIKKCQPSEIAGNSYLIRHQENGQQQVARECQLDREKVVWRADSLTAVLGRLD